MKVHICIKIKLHVTPKQSTRLHKVMIQNTKARNYDSAVYFRHQYNLKTKQYHKLTYHPTIDKFNLKSKMAQTDYQMVKVTYSAVNSQRKKTTYTFPDINDMHIVISKKTHKPYKKPTYHKCKEDGQWLWHRIHYHRPYADLQYRYDWNFLPKKHLISINTLSHQRGHGRIKCGYYIPKYFKKYLKMPHKIGACKLLSVGNKIWLHAGITLYVKSIKDLAHAVNIGGSDRGDRFIGFYKDDKGNVVSFKGLPIRRKRKHYLKLRATLQKSYSEHHNYSALKRLSKNKKQENNYVSNVNHKCSKILASSLGRGGVLGLEDLDGVRSQTKKVAKKHRYTQVSWAFGDFGKDCVYKIHKLGGRFTHVPARFTSQRDPITGKVGKAHRHHNIHTYYSFAYHSNKHGKKIHYKFNDDYVGGYNIHFLTMLTCLGYHKPTIQPNGSIKYTMTYKHKGKKHIKTLYLGRLQAIKIYQQYK